MVKIVSVEPGSIAADIGLESGDQLICINGHEINDLVDYHVYCLSDQVVLEVLKTESEICEFKLEKVADEDLGIELEHPQPQQCGNQCLFCFIHQLPRGLRRTLYIKDEDYRFSYLYGSYITLTNLKERDFERIIAQQLSPLYVSVHAIDHQVRRRMLGAEIPDIVPMIERLTRSGIQLHCQIVLCPGINDADILDQTIEFLGGLIPQVVSLAVVPVGLTAHRHNLPQLSGLTPEDARACLAQIKFWQGQLLSRTGTRFVFPADEIYLLAEEDIPDQDDYEDFPQFENGVGMIAQFRAQAEEVLLDAETLPINRVTLVTGCSFADELNAFAQRFAVRTGVACSVVAVKNDFFGSAVTVAGLITAGDLLAQLQGRDLGDAVLIPDVMLKEGEPIFLDDVTLKQLEDQLQLKVIAVESTPWGILEGLESLVAGPVEVIHC